MINEINFIIFHPLLHLSLKIYFLQCKNFFFAKFFFFTQKLNTHTLHLWVSNKIRYLNSFFILQIPLNKMNFFIVQNPIFFLFSTAQLDHRSATERILSNDLLFYFHRLLFILSSSCSPARSHSSLFHASFLAYHSFEKKKLFSY